MTNPSDDARPIVDLGLGGTIRIGGERVAVAEAVSVLNAIAETGSVQGVAAELGLSYRAAWERLRALEAALGRQLVQKTRGHGSVLTETGLTLRTALSDAAASLSGPLARETRALQARLGAAFGGAAPRLAVAASHDPLLVEACAEWGEGDVSIAGSEHAVARLVGGQADAAGFHCGVLALAEAGAPFAELADDPAIVVRPLFEREQGLMLGTGNPLGIERLADLVTARARYVNRQKGAGTRLWFDRLLAAEGIPASDIQGYATEEFTHQAVAAVIAYGAADAGLGVRSAAERFGLGFLPIGWEVYHLAAHASLPQAALDRLAALVAERVGRTKGYRLPAASET